MTTVQSAPCVFRLVRHIDVSGVSGTGAVAEGVQFSDGSVALRWRSQTPATSVWDAGLAAMLAVHGHAGCSVVEWLVPPHTAQCSPTLTAIWSDLPLSSGHSIPTASLDGLCARCFAAWPCMTCPSPHSGHSQDRRG